MRCLAEKGQTRRRFTVRCDLQVHCQEGRQPAARLRGGPPASWLGRRDGARNRHQPRQTRCMFVLISWLPLILGQDLMLVGMYKVLPLQGSLSLFSTSIGPSAQNEAYPVFAPTSHPVPVLESAPGSSITSSPLLDGLDLPASFILNEKKGDARTVFLILEHRCGLDKLRGRVVPGFPNIWLEETGSWGLRGVHPVRP